MHTEESKINRILFRIKFQLGSEFEITLRLLRFFLNLCHLSHSNSNQSLNSN